jgi:hypothetical protein
MLEALRQADERGSEQGRSAVVGILRSLPPHAAREQPLSAERLLWNLARFARWAEHDGVPGSLTAPVVEQARLAREALWHSAQRIWSGSHGREGTDVDLEPEVRLLGRVTEAVQPLRVLLAELNVLALRGELDEQAQRPIVAAAVARLAAEARELAGTDLGPARPGAPPTAGPPFWLAWVVAHAFGLPLAWGLSFGVAVVPSLLLQAALERLGVGPAFPAQVVLFGAVFGAALGAAEWLVLRDHLARPGRWIWATAAGCALGYGARVLRIEPLLLVGVPPALGGYSFALGVAVAAVAQWAVLRRSVTRSGWWLPVVAVLFPATQAVDTALTRGAGGPLSFYAVQLTQFAAAALYGAATGWLLAGLGVGGRAPVGRAAAGNP